jgi:hypothetical protein
VKITCNGFDTASVQMAIAELQKFKTDFDSKVMTVCEKLAQIGEVRARLDFADASRTYDGTNDVSVRVEPTGTGYRVVASGNAVLFIEFGSGTIGYGHPEPGIYGPGTWSDGPSGKKHWQDPGGWYYAHGKKSIGNPPAAAMYHAEQEVRQRIQEVVSEVFGT